MIYEFFISKSTSISVYLRYGVGIAGVCDLHSYLRYGVGIRGGHDSRKNRVHRLSRLQIALESL